MQIRLEKKIAVVTGGAKGIGAATAKLLEKAGARVEVLDVEAGCDVTDETQVEKAFARIGGIDILVNNAGRAVRKSAVEVQKADWDAVLDLNLTRALALEWAPDNIRVNAVAPTYVRTDLTTPIFSNPELLKTVMAHTPLGRLPEPGDIAAAILFLCSDAARCITGVTLPVDSGYLAR